MTPTSGWRAAEERRARTRISCSPGGRAIVSRQAPRPRSSSSFAYDLRAPVPRGDLQSDTSAAVKGASQDPDEVPQRDPLRDGGRRDGLLGGWTREAPANRSACGEAEWRL